MLEIKAKAITYIPKEFVDIADEFHELCWRRAGTYGRVGRCVSILDEHEWKKYATEGAKPSIQRENDY